MQFSPSQDLKALDVLIDSDPMEDLEGSTAVLERWLKDSEQEQSEKLELCMELLISMETRANAHRQEALKVMKRAHADEEKALYLETLVTKYL
jgi:polysaccharide pyruvyl transferase WcaK-like protein